MSDKDSTLTQDLLRGVLDYSPDSGTFAWKVNRSNVKAGTPAGTPTKNGYLVIRVFDNLHLAHRLAWAYMFGYPLPKFIDHIDGNKKNNAIANLRPCTKVTNGQNRRTAQTNNKSSGLLGVAWLDHVKKFTAYIDAGGKRKYLGLFLDKNDAHSAYLEAKRVLHEGCTI